MTSRDFAYWLQGFFEISGATDISAAQAQVIKNHLSMVFIHEIDPSFPKEQQKALDTAHKPETESHFSDFKPTPGMRC